MRDDWSINSPEWAYNTPGWKPRCVRCHARTKCRKYNSKELGTFAGEWICFPCIKDTDYLTPAECVIKDILNDWVNAQEIANRITELEKESK